MTQVINSIVTVNSGRNKGERGKVIALADECVYVDFDRKLLVDEGGGSLDNYDDGYWVNISNIA